MVNHSNRTNAKEVRIIRFAALERTKELSTPRLAGLLFKTWVGAILLARPLPRLSGPTGCRRMAR
jgi:hypothetical protein